MRDFLAFLLVLLIVCGVLWIARESVSYRPPVIVEKNDGSGG